jgi:hypothetical protein
LAANLAPAGEESSAPDTAVATNESVDVNASIPSGTTSELDGAGPGTDVREAVEADIEPPAVEADTGAPVVDADIEAPASDGTQADTEGSEGAAEPPDGASPANGQPVDTGELSASINTGNAKPRRRKKKSTK